MDKTTSKINDLQLYGVKAWNTAGKPLQPL